MLNQTHSRETLSNSSLIFTTTHICHCLFFLDFQERLPIRISNGNRNGQQISGDSGLDTSWMPSINASENSNLVSTEAAQPTSEVISEASHRFRYCQKRCVSKSSCRHVLLLLNRSYTPSSHSKESKFFYEGRRYHDDLLLKLMSRSFHKIYFY